MTSTELGEVEMRRWVILAVAVFATLLPAPPGEAAAAVAYRERLQVLYQSTHHAQLIIDIESARTEHFSFEGRTIEVTAWRATTPKGPAIAFAAPDKASVMGVLYNDSERLDAWQLVGREAASPLDVNAVGLPLGESAPRGVGVGDLVCGLVTGVVFGAIGAIVCAPAAPPVGSIVCGAATGGAGGVGGTAACAMGDEKTGRLQWGYTEDDPLGTKKSVRLYWSNYPEEGVYFHGYNDTCQPEDNTGACYQTFLVPGQLPRYEVRGVYYRAKVKWSDATRTDVYFYSDRKWIEISPVYHQSQYFLPDGYHYTIDVKVEQLMLLPEVGFQWVTLDKLVAFAAVCPSCSF